MRLIAKITAFRIAGLLAVVSLGVAAQSFFVLRNPGLTAMLGGSTSSGGGSAPPPSYLYSEDFEAFDATGWTVSGTYDTAYADPPAPLAGAYSFWGTNTAYIRNPSLFSASGPVWAYWTMVIKAVGTSSKAVTGVQPQWTNSASSTPWFYGADSNQTVRIAHGSVLAFSSATNLWHYEQPFHVWFYFDPGTGSDGVSRVWINTNEAVRPATPDAEITNGDRAWVMTGVRFFGGSSGSAIILDRYRISTNEIGDNPE